MSADTDEEELMPVFAFGTALGALLAYFFDPQNGKRRRHLLADRTGAFFRSSGRQAERAGGDVVVNVQDGVVQLRGEVERPELIETLIEQTRKVQGVKYVENSLYTPGTA